MAAWTSPRRVNSEATNVVVSGAVSWVTTVPVSTYASIPMTQTIASVSPSLSGQFGTAWQINSSYSGMVWNEAYGAGGAALFTGGGHSTVNFPYSWVFDGSLPGWRELNVTPPAFTYATGSEYSTVQANMPGDAVLYGEGWFRRQGPDTAWGYPAADDRVNYGESATNTPFGWHTYNVLFPIPANTAGMGSKGGWGCVVKHSMTRNSGVGCAWGHKIDANTGVWTRWPARLPQSIAIGNYMAAWCRATADSTYAYTSWGGEGGSRAVVRSDLATGAHTVITASNSPASTNNVVVIPGTTIMVSLAQSGENWFNGVSSRMTLRAQNIAASGNANVDCPMSNNTMPIGRGDADTGFGQAALMWVPEVGKLAVFGTSGDNTEATYGAWPLKIFWITPPADVQSNYNNAATPWVVSEEALSLPSPVTDPKANVKANRAPFGFEYQVCFWSSKLRCFIHIPQAWSGMCFFFRTALVP